MEDKRKETRVRSRGGVLYSFPLRDPEKMHSGLLSDLSSAGACIYTQECIMEGIVKIHFKDMDRDPMNAEVKWCVKSLEDLFRAGLQFQR